MEYRELSYLLLCVAAGFLSGSIMFSQVIPKLFLHIDITAISEDHNPGASNVFIHCGPVWGLICLSLDMLKGFIPVFLSFHFLDPDNILFAAVMAAPVFGHAIALFQHYRGGKCIATAFGALLGLFKLSHIVLLLAGIYMIFSTILKINPNRIRSITSFGLFGFLSLIVLLYRSQYSIALGCVLISIIAVVKHMKYFEEERYSPMV